MVIGEEGTECSQGCNQLIQQYQLMSEMKSSKRHFTKMALDSLGLK